MALSRLNLNWFKMAVDGLIKRMYGPFPVEAALRVSPCVTFTIVMMLGGDKKMLGRDWMMLGRDRMMLGRDRMMLGRDRMMLGRDWIIYTPLTGPSGIVVVDPVDVVQPLHLSTRRYTTLP